MKSKILAGTLIAAGVLVAVAKDPVIMKVAGVDVPKSEFEYLYHKNSQQQIEPQTLDSYVDMFTIYKLKVADAKAQGLDTTPQFKRELEQYRSDLAAPFLTDSAYIYSIAREEYERGREEVEAIHIMVLKDQNGNNAPKKALADSLYNLVKSGEDFGDVAVKYSEDRSAKRNRGNMGFIQVMRLPYEFEKAAFSLKKGELSHGVVESPVGYHVMMGGERRPARGTVLAAHIMKMCPPGASAEDEEKAKASIDSIYALVKANPAIFEVVAYQESDDKNSARQGGRLPWFGTGEMVRPFEDAAFELEPGEISEPVRSQYGWHIIRVIDKKGYPSFDEKKQGMINRITNPHPQNEYARMLRDRQTSKLAKKLKGKLNDKLVAEMRGYVLENGIDSAFYAKFKSAPYDHMVIATVAKEKHLVPEFFERMRVTNIAAGEGAVDILNNNLDGYLHNTLLRAEESRLEKDEPEYAHLLNEYRDGSMLYEASLARVWNKASQDETGLKNYFEAHRNDYTWKEPRVKGYLVQATNDSIAETVRVRMADVKDDDMLRTVKKDFAGKASIDKVLVPKGQNAMIDNLMFDGPAATPQNANYTTYFLYDARLIDAPEDVTDVKGLVTSDYQNQLESEWVEELKAKYPVVVYDKVVKTVK